MAIETRTEQYMDPSMAEMRAQANGTVHPEAKTDQLKEEVLPQVEGREEDPLVVFIKQGLVGSLRDLSKKALEVAAKLELTAAGLEGEQLDREFLAVIDAGFAATRVESSISRGLKDRKRKADEAKRKEQTEMDTPKS